MTDAVDAKIRIQKILESEAGLARPDAAREIAFSTDMAADGAIALLAKLPSENQFQTMMDQGGAVGVRAAAPGAPGSSDPRAARLAELSATARAHNIAKGYVVARPPQHSDK